MKRVELAGLVVAIVVALVVASEVHAGTSAKAPARLAPPVACTSSNRMDIFVDEDNILWECSCEMLKTGNICRWQVIGEVDAVAVRIRRKIEGRLLPRHFWYHAAYRYLTVLR
jgi:hypothetical protein